MKRKWEFYPGIEMSSIGISIPPLASCHHFDNAIYKTPKAGAKSVRFIVEIFSSALSNPETRKRTIGMRIPINEVISLQKALADHNFLDARAGHFLLGEHSLFSRRVAFAGVRSSTELLSRYHRKLVSWHNLDGIMNS